MVSFYDCPYNYSNEIEISGQKLGIFILKISTFKISIENKM